DTSWPYRVGLSLSQTGRKTLRPPSAACGGNDDNHFKNDKNVQQVAEKITGLRQVHDNTKYNIPGRPPN
ncbi:unnamed protein product, partial [Laminaria digitata]